VVIELTDYDSYDMGLRERMLYIVLASGVIFVIAFIFYRSILLSMLLVPLSLLYPGIKTRAIIARRKKELNIQFKDMLYSLSSSISAGKTVEGAFREVLKDLPVMYPEPNTFILVEISRIISRLDTNETLESALSDFSLRAKLDDVDNFVNVFNICKRSGGNLSEVIKNTSAIINDRIEVAQEVDTMLAERKFEQKVLNVVPILMILMLSATAPDYMSPVFNTSMGRFTMSISILLLAAAWFISAKFCNIKL
jgi:tight adherence protein B